LSIGSATQLAGASPGGTPLTLDSFVRAVEFARMSRQRRRKHSGDAANLFIRAILGEASWLLGGLTDEEWQRTMDYFGGRCAYTDEPLVVGEIDQDHVVLMNMKECGLRLFGNVLPLIKEANAAKHARPYVDFVRDPQRRSKIDTFVREAGYNHRARSLGDLRDYCRSQYELINSLFGEAKSYLHELAPGNSNGPTRTPRQMGLESGAALQQHGTQHTLPITLDPEDDQTFRDALLKTRRATITLYFSDGRTERRPWRASSFRATSNVIRNLRSRPDFRQGAWQRLGIVRVHVSVEPDRD